MCAYMLYNFVLRKKMAKMHFELHKALTAFLGPLIVLIKNTFLTF